MCGVAALVRLLARAREDIVRRLRLGDVWILITTDLMARGMDFKGVKLVVNYDFPQVGRSKHLPALVPPFF